MRKTSIAMLGIAVLLASCRPSKPILPAISPTVEQPTVVSTTPAAAVPTPTQGDLPNADWQTYHDSRAAFSIQHPLTWRESDAGGYPVVFNLTAVPGTTLISKSMEINVTENAADCKEITYTSDTGTTSPKNVTENGISFLRESGSGFVAGNIYDWTSYSTMKGSTCINLTFVLHSANSGVYSTEPAPFDKSAESTIFASLLNTFQFDK